MGQEVIPFDPQDSPSVTTMMNILRSSVSLV